MNTPCWNSIPPHLKQSQHLCGNELALELTKEYWSLISPEDAGLASFLWIAFKSGDLVYAGRGVAKPEHSERRIQLLHRVIATASAQDVEVDHRDQHILLPFRLLDNRRENLRIVTRTENNANRRSKHGSSSRFKGVRWDKQQRAWRARIARNYRQLDLGSFSTEEAAAEAYNLAHGFLYPGFQEGHNAL